MIITCIAKFQKLSVVIVQSLSMLLFDTRWRCITTSNLNNKFYAIRHKMALKYF